MSLGGFAALRALSTRNDDPANGGRPFDKDRDGFIIGEGAGTLILEELEHATTRGAHIYAEIVGYGMSADAYHITAPSEDGDGGVRVMRDGASERPASSRTSGLHQRPRHLDAVQRQARNAGHQALFGDHARKLAISSTKSMTGHLLGGAGGLEAGISALAVHHQMAPPTINLEHPDPECDLDYVPLQEPPDADHLRAVQLVRLRRHQRGAAVQEVRSVIALSAFGASRRSTSSASPCLRQPRVANV